MILCYAASLLLNFRVLAHMKKKRGKSAWRCLHRLHSQQGKMTSCQSDLCRWDGERFHLRCLWLSCGGIAGCNPWHRPCLLLCFSYRPDSGMFFLPRRGTTSVLSPASGASSLQPRHAGVQQQQQQKKKKRKQTQQLCSCVNPLQLLVCNYYHWLETLISAKTKHRKYCACRWGKFVLVTVS